MLARCVRWCSVAVVMVFLASSSALAQATGKVQGRVLNAQTGQPIAGATVRVEGTSLGAITSNDGYYFINEVFAGLHTVVAEFIGFRTVTIQDQRILAGQTETLNFELDVSAVEIEPLIVEGQRNPLVPRDQVSSKAIVTGTLVDALPVIAPNQVITLQAGVIETNCTLGPDPGNIPGATCRTIRGSRPNEEAVYIDGVLTRRYSNAQAQPIGLPTNSLAEIGVTTGGISAQFGQAQSGVVNFVTRSGGLNFNGSFTLMTDNIAPDSWRTGFNRLEFSLGGPISRSANLSFFLGGTLNGQKYQPANDGFRDVPILLPQGVAMMDDGTTPAIFSLARESSSADATDSLRLAFPNYVDWNNGRTLPFNNTDVTQGVAKVSWGFGTGSNLDLSYKRQRIQNIQLDVLGTGATVRRTVGVSELYNPNGFDGVFNEADVFTLGGYFLIKQTPTSALALDLKASYQSFYDQFGELDPDWLPGHVNPGLGINFGNLKFLVDTDDWPVTETLVNAVRSGAFPAESLQVYPGRFDLNNKQSLNGLADNLRMNPYGLRRFFNVSGSGNAGMEYRNESNWVFNATADWQLGRYNRIRLGGDLTLIDTERIRVPLFTATAIPAANKPTYAGLFITDRLDLGDVVIDAGLRWDYFKPDGEFPRIPGYVFNVPDSLKADFVRVEAGEGALLDRVVPLENCGGDATAADRTNAVTGEVVCKPNFIAASNKSELSPRIAVAFPVTVSSTFRLSYSQNVQVPALMGQSFGAVGAAAGQTAIFNDVYADFQGGLANTNALFGRDVEMPRTVLFEAGYRQLIQQNLVLDLAIYSKTVRNGLTYRKLQFEDPNVAGQDIFINVLTNRDFTQIYGLDFRLDYRIGQILDFAGNYSYVDAKGTGSDPFTYTSLLLRSNTNLSIITGAPVTPPDAILPLETNRVHNIGGTVSLLFPPDYNVGVLRDFGWFTTYRFASGLPYTGLVNSANGQLGPPTRAGLGGTPSEELNSSNTPWFSQIDFRFVKGFRVARQRLRLFADWLNPFNLSNTNLVYLETGTAENSALQEKLVNQQLTDPLLDGDSEIDDFNIALESPENEFNKFSLSQAEKRFGNGDGIFSVAEQRAAFGAQYTLFNGPQRFLQSNQTLRLGFEFVF